ncbi:MAG: ester cyclase [Burkholderiales bacterium]|nr:ester cyclase [Anaerolineae bacterium]
MAADKRTTSNASIMPKDFSISLDNYIRGGTDRFLLNPPKVSPRKQSMQGFEPQYVDIIDYIVRITHRIWEEGGIGYIYDTYRHNSRVHDDVGLQYGRDKIVADTITTINAFPDIRLYADDIIWAGNDKVGFNTSHRTVILGHNTGPSRFGPPTGKKVHVWCIANCVAVENEIYEEWVLYNNSALIKQLGFNLFDVARQFAAQRAEQAEVSGLHDPRSGEPERLPGQGKPPVYPAKTSTGFDVEDFIRRAYHEVWNWRLLNKLHDYYIPNVRVHGATDREFYGIGAYKSYILSVMAMFPDLAFHIDDFYWMGNDEDGYRTSMRWSIVGTHRGPGIYGQPTGKQIYMWGINQHTIKDGLIQEEWTLFNEFALIQQLVS